MPFHPNYKNDQYHVWQCISSAFYSSRTYPLILIYKVCLDYFSYTTNAIWIKCYKIEWYIKLLYIFNGYHGWKIFCWFIVLWYPPKVQCSASSVEWFSISIHYRIIQTVKLHFQQIVRSPLQLHVLNWLLSGDPRDI